MRFARNSAEFSALLSGTPGAGVVVDPLIDGNESTTIHELLRRCPPERIVLYVDQTPEILHDHMG